MINKKDKIFFFVNLVLILSAFLVGTFVTKANFEDATNHYKTELAKCIEDGKPNHNIIIPMENIDIEVIKNSSYDTKYPRPTRT